MACVLTKAIRQNVENPIKLCKTKLLRRAVIWSFTGDSYIVGMTFSNSCIRNSGKPGLMQILNRFGTAIAHTGTQTSNHLVDNLIEIPFVGYAR